MKHQTSQDFIDRQKNTILRMTKEIGDLNRKLKKSNDALLKIRGMAMRSIVDLGVSDA